LTPGEGVGDDRRMPIDSPDSNTSTLHLDGHQRRRREHAVRASLVACAAALSATAGAATYTCIGADGKKSFSDRPCPAETVATTGAARRDAGAGGYLSPRHGMTFGLQAQSGDTVSASCLARPAPQDRPRDGGCDAERGDTACSRALPVLCIKAPERRARTPVVIDANSGRITPPPASEGLQLGASPALRGDSLASQQSGTQACERALGSGWRMVSYQDSTSWTTAPHRHDSLAQATGRFWVAVGDAPGNCWNAPPQPVAAPAVPVDEQQLTADILKMRSSPEFAGLSSKCRQSYDKVERALRQNKEGALFSEASLAPLMEWMEQCSGKDQAPR
jgi:Domain of unknown function (DUF4124)